MKCEHCRHNFWSSYNPDSSYWCECGIGVDEISYDILYIGCGCKLKSQEARKLARLNQDMIGKSYYGYDFVDNEGEFIPLERMTEEQRGEYLKAKQDFNKATKKYDEYREYLEEKYKEK